MTTKDTQQRASREEEGWKGHPGSDHTGLSTLVVLEFFNTENQASFHANYLTDCLITGPLPGKFFKGP